MKIIVTSLIQVIAIIAIIGETFAVNWNGNNWALGCDFVGDDLSSRQSSGEKCGGICANTAGCTHYTWTNLNGGTCWMKKNPTSKGNAKDTGDNSMVCGLVDDAIKWNGNNWASACDFNNNDLSSVRSSAEQCGGICANTGGCTHFTWTNLNGGTCWMKKNGATKDNAKYTGDNGMICGINLKSPQSILELGACYDPMHNAEYPLNGQSLNKNALEQAIDDDFRQIAKYFRYIRTFNSAFYDIPVAPAANKYGVKLYLGVYMTDENWYQAQVDAAVQSVKNFPNTIEAILVGNENLRPNGPYSADQIISRIEDLKNSIRSATGRNIPVGTVQRITEWVNPSIRSETRKLADKSDIIGVNIYPFFGHPSSNVDSDMQMLNAQWNSMIDIYGSSKVRLTETGFPTDGGASPSGNKADLRRSVAYFKAVQNWRPVGQGPAFWFAFYDRRPDDNTVPGAFEKHFGLFTDRRNSKNGFFNK